MKKTISTLLIFTLALSLIAQNESQQPSEQGPWPGDMVSIGLGIGLDHGGFGGNVTYYPVKNIGLFGGVGYAIAGVGFNVGAKFRFSLIHHWSPIFTVP